MLDPCASIEFARGCPWDCSFCSAWTFYGRSYRTASPEVVGRRTGARSASPACSSSTTWPSSTAEHGMAIGEAMARRNVRKQYYLETRGDVLLRNKDVFRFWQALGLEYMFLGLEAIDAEGLKRFRKRVTPGPNFEALEFARSLGIMVAINIIADPDWDHERFEVIRAVVPGDPGDRQHQRQHALSGHGDLAPRAAAADHARLPAVRHPARGAADQAAAGRVLRRSWCGPSKCSTASTWAGGAAATPPASALRLLARGQTNFLRMLWRFNSVFNPELQLADHASRCATRCGAAAGAPAGSIRSRCTCTPGGRAAGRSTMRRSGSWTTPGWARPRTDTHRHGACPAIMPGRLPRAPNAPRPARNDARAGAALEDPPRLAQVILLSRGGPAATAAAGGRRS